MPFDVTLRPQVLAVIRSSYSVESIINQKQLHRLSEGRDLYNRTTCVATAALLAKCEMGYSIACTASYECSLLNQMTSNI